MSPRAAWPQVPAAPNAVIPIDPTGLASLKRTIRVFDFEEAERRLVEFPDSFYRRSGRDGASAEGFPAFGSMTLSRDRAFRGHWSFKFELDGGSMAARTFDGVLPILPHVDYAVTARVRTAGLINARARLVAWFADSGGRVVPGSRTESELVRTPETWETISVEVLGDHADAADLVVELQVLQPRQFLGREADLDEPILEDFSGSVWFDDVRVLHVPRAELHSLSPGNITRRPDTPHLSLLVRDHADEPLVSRLLVFDIDGELVFEDEYGPARGQQRKEVALPIERCGWYRAVLLVRSDGRLTGRRWLDFAVVSERTRSLAASQNRFGVVLPEQPPDRLIRAAALVDRLEIGNVVLPIWTRRMTQPGRTDGFDRLREAIARLVATDVDLTFALNELPDELSQTLGLDPGQVLAMFGEDPRVWGPYLETLLVNFGLEVRRWQIGATGSTDYVANADLGRELDAAHEALRRFVADPHLYIPWPAEYALPDDHGVESIHTTIPYHIQPEALADYVGTWRQATQNILATVEPLPHDEFLPRQQAVDLMLRALRLWRTDVEEINITAPWTWTRRHGDQPAIKPTYPVWRTIADRLNGRTFGGELATEDGVSIWILKGQISRDSALVVWTDRRRTGPVEPVRMFLGSEPVRAIDAFGNESELPPVNGLHTITPAEMPVFIENVNLELAQFRSAFALEDSYVAAMNRVHPHAIVLHNPWNMVISGEISLTDTEDLEIQPRTLPFTIRPGMTARLPVQVVVGRNVLVGRKTLRARARISADRDYVVDVRTGAEVGLPHVEFTASWSQAVNVETGSTDLVITQTVTNTGGDVLNLDVFVMAPHSPVLRRTLPPLGPGESATRRFNLGQSSAMIAARDIRVGVEERDGAVRLNRLMTVPISEKTAATAGVTSD